MPALHDGHAEDACRRPSTANQQPDAVHPRGARSPRYTSYTSHSTHLHGTCTPTGAQERRAAHVRNP
eukprot:6355341-Prymnesium_polylepis.1